MDTEENCGVKAVQWRDFNLEVIMPLHRAWGLAKVTADKKARPYGSPNQKPCMNAHRTWVNEVINPTRGAGNSGYSKAVKPYWDARDIAFYFFGVSCEAADIAGYEAMMAHYGVDAPSWAWW